MDNNIICVNHISKSFKVFSDRSYNLKEKLLFKNRNRYDIHQVIKDISFNVKKGEAIGLIGNNGCGKSTTLKMLSRIMYPDSGSIEIKGRVSALIELGAGFHPDMSGRENIYINAAIFGLSRAEIDNRMQTIIDFSELGEFIDNPVRTYSSGMYMRLAFSVAINVDADVLLIDEILAVGDAAFQNKCFNKLLEIKEKGTTIVIVSHSLGQIEQICDKSYWIKDGFIEMQGKPKAVHTAYEDYMSKKSMLKADAEVENDQNRNEQDKSKADLLEKMHVLNGRCVENGISARPGGTIYGPYLDLKPGKYEFFLEFSFQKAEVLFCRVTGNQGKKEFCGFPVYSGVNRGFICFDKQENDVEFVVTNTQAEENLILKSIRLIEVE